jgi:hypothetical protein
MHRKKEKMHNEIKEKMHNEIKEKMHNEIKEEMHRKKEKMHNEINEKMHRKKRKDAQRKKRKDAQRNKRKDAQRKKRKVAQRKVKKRCTKKSKEKMLKEIKEKMHIGRKEKMHIGRKEKMQKRKEERYEERESVDLALLLPLLPRELVTSCPHNALKNLTFVRNCFSAVDWLHLQTNSRQEVSMLRTPFLKLCNHQSSNKLFGQIPDGTHIVCISLKLPPWRDSISRPIAPVSSEHMLCMFLCTYVH